MFSWNPGRFHSSSQRARHVLLAVLVTLAIANSAASAITPLWTRTANGAADLTDAGEDVVLAPNGDIYVVGWKWVAAIDWNIWIRKYSPSGTTKWTRVVDSAMVGGFDAASGAAVDSAGNLYVVGRVATTGGDNDIWIRKYSSAGDKLWTRTYNGPASTSDYGASVALDSADNLYVVGNISVPGEQTNIWLRKYGSDGAKKWTRTVNGSANEFDYGNGVAVDSARNVYVVGSVQTATGEDFWIRKYNRSGTKLWTRTIDGPTGGSDRGLDATIDSSDNLIVSGYITVAGEGENMWVRKYTPLGQKVWTRTWSGAAEAPDHARGVCVDSNDAVYVIGLRSRQDFTSVAQIRKYSSSGVRRWTTVYTGPEGNAKGTSITVNAAKDIYVTGEVTKAGQGPDIWVRKYEQ